MTQPPPPPYPAYQPAPAGWAPPPQAVGYGYGFVPQGARPVVKRRSYTWLFVVLGVVLLVAVGVFVLIASTSTPKTPAANPCPPTCPPPPVGRAVLSEKTFTAADGSFTVQYPDSPNIKLISDGYVLSTSIGALSMQGGPAKGKSAQDFASSWISAHLPDAKRAYAIPNAFVGYHAGYGEVDDVYTQSTNGASVHERLVVLAAVHDDVGVVAVALGPYEKYSQSGLNDAHPSGTALHLAFALDRYANSARWKGDPQR